MPNRREVRALEEQRDVLYARLTLASANIRDALQLLHAWDRGRCGRDAVRRAIALLSVAVERAEESPR